MADIKDKANYGDPEAELKKKEQGFFKTYIVIIPDERRLYDIWMFFMSCAIIVEMILFPYAVCTHV
jgi:hypothetical protein